MQTSRDTPTPPRAGRPLTQEVIQQYRQLFEAARLHRPVSPTLPPSPPASSSAETGPSPASSESSGKRKRDETSSTESVSLPNKRSHHLDYHVPTRTRRGPPSKEMEIAPNHIKRATGYKRRADKDQHTMQSAVGANFYALSLLNFAFAYRLDSNMPWSSLNPMMNIMIDRFSKLSRKEPGPKLDAWMSYLQLFKNAVELQQDQDHIMVLRRQIDEQHKRAQQHLESTPAQITGASTSSALGTSAIEIVASSLPGTPLQRAATPKVAPEGHFTLNWDEAKALSTILGRARNGPHNKEGRRTVLKHLNPLVLRTHFPRTFMRAFGEDGIGHTSNVQDGGSPPDLTDQKGPLNVWEEHEIWDLEANEQEGGDFPYPHHPDDIFWVVILGRSMLTELRLPENV